MCAEQRKLATFMFTDMVGYSALAQKNDALAVEFLTAHREILRRVFANHAGRELDAVGDGFLVEFASEVDATRCAIEIQQTLAIRNAGTTPEQRIQIRIGIHLGDVVMRDGRAHGDGINIAARIEPLATPGGICLSEDVARQVRNKIDLPLRKLGKGDLKNIQTPVDIYTVVLSGARASFPFWGRIGFSLRQPRNRCHSSLI
jgi:adenylate cyclase